MIKANDRTLKSIIEELVETYRLKDKLVETRLLQSWEKVTGKMISKYTRDLYIHNRKLYVKLDSPALKHELGYARQKILDLLNEEAGETVITDIVFL